MSESESLTPVQQEIRGQIDTIRGDSKHPANDAGHRLHEQEYENFLTLYRQLHAEPAPAAATGVGARDEEPPAQVLAKPDDAETAPRPSVFDDPHAELQTAAYLAAMPPPTFSPAAEKAGWRWDVAKLPALYVTAEKEGLVPLVRDGMHLITRLAAEPALDLEAEHGAVIQSWGPRFSAKMDAVDRFEALMRKSQPAVLAELERTGKTEHRLWLEYAARGGEQMMDPSTSHGFARLKAKYQEAS